MTRPTILLCDKHKMFPWLSHQLISITNNLLCELKRKQVLIQTFTQGVCIMSKILILLYFICYWKGEDESLLHFLFQTAIIGLGYFFWNPYLELEPNKLQKLCGSSSGKCFLGMVSQLQGKPSRIVWWVDLCWMKDTHQDAL